jgi:hypothetical protein
MLRTCRGGLSNLTHVGSSILIASGFGVSECQGVCIPFSTLRLLILLRTLFEVLSYSLRNMTCQNMSDSCLMLFVHVLGYHVVMPQPLKHETWAESRVVCCASGGSSLSYMDINPGPE